MVKERVLRSEKTKTRSKKMAAFYNQASINLGGSVTNSNITVGEITSGITLTKTAATSEYGAGEGITYVVSAVNSGLSEYNGLTLTDDLGRFTVGAQVITPLTYVEGSLIFYLDGVIQPAPTVTLGETLAIGPFNIPAGSNATVIYEARANQTAPLDAGASITNTVTLVGGSCELSDSATVPTRDEPRLTIAKAVCPQSVTCAGEITYTVIIQNLGNTPVVATDDLIVNDTFNPILNNITVTLDGTALAEGAGYTYNVATGEFATLPGTVTVPAASFTRDPATGIISTTPGVAVITVTGTL